MKREPDRRVALDLTVSRINALAPSFRLRDGALAQDDHATAGHVIALGVACRVDADLGSGRHHDVLVQDRPSDDRAGPDGHVVHQHAVNDLTPGRQAASR